MDDDLSFLVRDLRTAPREGVEAMARRQRDRLADAVAHARARSRYYRELYAGLPDRVDDPALLPVTTKNALMARFDDWVTDPEATMARVREFVADPDSVGDRFLDRYLVTTTSGTSGERGIFLQDNRNRVLANALTRRSVATVDGTSTLLRIGLRVWLHRGRGAAVVASGGHMALNAGVVAEQKAGTRMGRANRVLSAHRPVADLVDELNHYRPVVLWCYATVLSLLAGEAEAGRLRIRPAVVALFGEGLPERDYPRIAAAFRGAAIHNMYGSNENGALSVACAHGWFHSHTDWVVFEPVDADRRPTPPGEYSHTVLVSALYNRIQPILRYELGDSVLMRPDPCPCGDPLPAFQVHGHSTDALTFTTDGGTVRLSPLLTKSVLSRTGDIRVFQVAHTAPATLRVRLLLMAGADEQHIWQRVHADLRALLADHGLDHVTVERASEPPEQTEGGKYRMLIPYRP